MKRNKFLKILSCVLGCFAICGLSLFSILGNKKDISRVNAEQHEVAFGNVTLNALSASSGSLGYSFFSEGSNLGYSYRSITEGGSVSYRLFYNLWFNKLTFISQDYSNTFYDTTEHTLVYQINDTREFNYVRFYATAVQPDISVYQGVIIRAYVDIICTYDYGFNNGTYTTWLGSGTVESSFSLRNYESTLPSNIDTIMSSIPLIPPVLIGELQYSNALSDYYDGYYTGFEEGYTQGVNEAFYNGQQLGYEEGYNQGVLDNQASSQVLIENAYQSGYSSGYADADNQDSTVASIFSGILTVGMLPVNFFLQIFNFEILGINLSAFISAIFTVALTIIVIKTVTGKGGGGNDK